jgi:hypothetical protein
MKHLTLFLFTFSSLVSGRDISGIWKLQVEPPGVPVAEVEMRLTQQENILGGVYKSRVGSFAIEGTAKDDKFEFVVVTQVGDLIFSGKVDPDGKKLDGTIEDPQKNKGKIKGERTGDLPESYSPKEDLQKNKGKAKGKNKDKNKSGEAGGTN